ncbi:MAG TPA: carboxypeptidase regulatory-like domain-containing protein [Pyrinomonadaceae bacterium]|nr:carboxypeptidase regulatory-like domain-containing protein [Pyrinomonadaceae bacterium]
MISNPEEQSSSLAQLSLFSKAPFLFLFILLSWGPMSISDHFVSTAYAQASSAVLSGIVVDPQGAVVPAVSITAINADTAMRRETSTDKSGSFVIPLLLPGRYVVVAQRNGFRPFQNKDVVLHVGDQQVLKIQLELGEISESVNIDGTSFIQTESAAVSTVVDHQFVENLPLNGRSFGSLIELTPGVVLTRSNGVEQGQFSVNGQRANANYFMVDGVGANVGNVSNQSVAGTIPTFSVLGGMNSLVSVDALREFRVQTSTYAAEFGRMPGAQVSVVTRSGTNDFHGDVFDYFRNDALDANDWFANSRGQSKPALRQNDFGGVVGGPIVKDRTFFFFSYEGLRLRQPQFAVTEAPTLAVRNAVPAALKPFIFAFPIPNGRDLGGGFAESFAGYSNPTTLDATSIRVDHSFSNTMTLFGRYNYAPSDATQRSSTTLNQLQTNQLNTTTVTIGLTQSFSPQTNNDLRINCSRNTQMQILSLDDFAGGVPPSDAAMFPPITNRGASLFQFNLGPLFYEVGLNDVSSSQRQFNLVDNFLITTGTHQLKLGVDYRRIAPNWAVLGENGMAIAPFFEDTQSAISNTPLFVDVEFDARRFPLLTNFSAYGQDSWRASPRLSVSYGLRWEVNTPPTDRHGSYAFTVAGLDNPATMTLAPFGTPQWKTTYNNFAPRVGVAYRLSQSTGRETVIRGGFGIFYDVGTGPIGKGIIGVTLPYDRIQEFQTFPFDFNNISVPPIDFNPKPPYGALFVSDPNLKLPRTYEWNVSTERSIGINQTFTVSYIGAAGRRLLRVEQLRLGSLPNPNFTRVQVTTNAGTSDYEALQLQYQRRLSRGLQALASYTWSHSIDLVSADSSFGVTTARIDPGIDRGPSDFDVRHSFSAAVTYDVPNVHENKFARMVLRDWSIDAIFRARTAIPFTVFSNRNLFGAGSARADLIAGVPIYITDAMVAGGRRLNRAAFATPPAGRQGTLGRNSVRGFPLSQLDFSFRRRFPVGERLNLQLRADLFNVFNHPNFATPNSLLSDQLFGQSTKMLGRELSGGDGSLSPLYQIGGPRSIQLSLKLGF